VWERRVDGRILTFHLAGINNQNFLMKDEETGSWWQQVTGAAILGPLKGARLRRVDHDDVSFATWREEHPRTRVLRPDPAFSAKYAPADWEAKMASVPVVTPGDPKDPISPRALVAGVSIGDSSRAYLVEGMSGEGPINDLVDGVAIVLVTGDGGRSVRAYRRDAAGRRLEFFGKAGPPPGTWLDSETGSEWNFAGSALSGPLAGTRLERVPVLLDYWFDWKAYHPETDVHSAGLPDSGTGPSAGPETRPASSPE
jgi:uncharacterized protein DUF3179